MKRVTLAEVALQSQRIFSSWVMPLIPPVDSGSMFPCPVHLILAGSDRLSAKDGGMEERECPS